MYTEYTNSKMSMQLAHQDDESHNETTVSINFTINVKTTERLDCPNKS